MKDGLLIAAMILIATLSVAMVVIIVTLFFAE